MINDSFEYEERIAELEDELLQQTYEIDSLKETIVELKAELKTKKEQIRYLEKQSQQNIKWNTNVEWMKKHANSSTKENFFDPLKYDEECSQEFVKRNTGKTTHQIKTAPKNAYYLCCSFEHMRHCQQIMSKNGRSDLKCMTPTYFDGYSPFMGLRNIVLVIDHAAYLNMTSTQMYNLIDSIKMTNSKFYLYEDMKI